MTVATPTTPIHWNALANLAAADSEFISLARGAEVTFALRTRAGSEVTLFVQGGTVKPGTDPQFTVELDESSWHSVTATTPTPGRQHILAHLEPRGSGTVQGDRMKFAQHLHLVRRATELLANRPDSKHDPATKQDNDSDGTLAAVAGRYVRITVEPWGSCDVFVESVGSGRPVVLLHTAGGDARQYHGLFRLAAKFPDRQLIAFDLPWHGRSSPAIGASVHDYHLTSDSYSACVAAVITALQLPTPPVIVGASMAGAAALEVAARYPEILSGVVSCQAGPRVANRHNAWQRSPCVNQTLFVPEWTYGLMSPHSPKADRDRVWWNYSQGGYGVYERDITYYTTCWDVDNITPLLGQSTPPIVLMSGAYDYSVPSEATQILARTIPGAIYHDMPELGHFPHAENPPVFADHLTWALSAIDDAHASTHR